MAAQGTPIADGISEIKRDAAERLPAETRAAFATEVARLVEKGTAGAATPGAPMPDGDLLDAQGKPATLAAARDGRPAVVVFYRGLWCPYCNVALRVYQEQLLGELDALGVALIALSPQTPDSSLSTVEKHELAYTVLSDPGNEIARALGLVFTLADETRDVQAKLGVDVATFNADGTYELPLATTLVVDADGVIRWIDVRPDYTTRAEPADILAAVKAL